VPVPNIYVAWPLADRISAGFGVNAPFGLVTEYDDEWIGRFQGIKSDQRRGLWVVEVLALGHLHARNKYNEPPSYSSALR
jgi:hypothetical protein